MKKKLDKKKDKNPKTFTRRSLRQYVMGIFERNPSHFYNYKQIGKRLGVKDTSTKRLLVKTLAELANEEKLDEISAGKYKLKIHSGYINGKVDLTRNGAAYIISDELEKDVFVSPAHLRNAMQGDEVKVYIFARRKDEKLEGEIIEIIKRARETFVGTIERGVKHAFLVTENKDMPYDIYIAAPDINGAKDGQKAIVKITEWPRHAKNPMGTVIQVLGNAGEHETEIHAILAEFGLPYSFPVALDKEAEKIEAGITEEEIAKRKDFRNTTTFTIDPVDAKDFDDALSLKELENGNWEVGVHIADVTHYVKEGSNIDKEAEERATSVYLVDRVVPMLPERLSNFICSLRPEEEKLTFSAVFEITDEAEIVGQWFGRTIINSNRRFTYEEAQQIIETEEGEFAEEILLLDRLAKQLRKKRFTKGSIDFDRIEVRFKIDEKGKPLEVYFKESKDSNRLIEEFMLLANKKVATSIGKTKEGAAKKTFVYRIHDEPNAEKIQAFAKFIKTFGKELDYSTPKTIAKSLNQLITEVHGTKEQNVVEQLAIRSMAKAKYSTANIGHYGLAFTYYTHFTSPIRRYPDMMVHRLLDKYQKGGGSVMKRTYENHCKHSSDMEHKAAQAERASIKYKQVEYMKDKVGDVFAGVITGVTQWGVYVEISENKIEGMVSLRDMEDDYYMFDEENYCIKGQKHGIKYQLGDNVNIQIVRANILKKQLDFMFVDENKD